VKETKEDSAHQNEVTPAVKKMKINWASEIHALH
jgi:hypothetical protein